MDTNRLRRLLSRCLSWQEFEGRPDGGERKFFKETQGSHMKPGVRGPADTREEESGRESFVQSGKCHQAVVERVWADMDDWFSMIGSDCELPGRAAEELQDAGFPIIPGPVAIDRLAGFSAAYDAAMASGNAADLKFASTTTRLYDFVNRGVEFDDVYVYPVYPAPSSGVS